METLEIFLEALEKVFEGKRGIFVPKKTSIPNSKFPVYTEVLVEIWCVNGDYKTLVSEVKVTKRVTNQEEQKELDKIVALESIKSVLKYYGL